MFDPKGVLDGGSEDPMSQHLRYRINDAEHANDPDGHR